MVSVKLFIFNVKYSPNLGDGLLSECLELELRRAIGRPEVVSLDLAGRDQYGPGSRRREFALTLLERLPARLRRAVADAILSFLVRRRLERLWRERLSGADGVIVGGGNLFADVDLNFPIKINGALRAAARHALPVAIHSVGATANWSARGSKLFVEALCGSRLIDATVRDERSRAIWQRLLAPAGIVAAGIAPDPGLLTSLHFPPVPRTSSNRRAALGITSPVALRYHSNLPVAHALDLWLTELVDGLVAQGYEVALFTNGSPEDRAFLALLGDRLVACAPDRVRIEPAFARPADLARFISGHDLVLGHRMHAAIAAYSYGIPAIGFAWDVKMESFFDLTGYGERLIDPAKVTAAAAAALAHRAVAEGVHPGTRDRLIGASRKGIARLAALFAAAGT